MKVPSQSGLVQENKSQLRHHRCVKCGVPVITLRNKNMTGLVTIDERLARLLTLADYKIYGVIEGHRVHKCKSGQTEMFKEE